jgi:hypothetical protein
MDPQYSRHPQHQFGSQARQPEVDRQGNFVLYKPSHPDLGQNYVNARRLFQQAPAEPQPPLYPQQQFEQPQRAPPMRSMSSSNQPLSRGFGNPLVTPFAAPNQAQQQGAAAFVRSYGGREPNPNFLSPQHLPPNFQYQQAQPVSQFDQRPPAVYNSATDQQSRFNNPPPQSVPIFTRSLNSTFTPNNQFFHRPPQPQPQPQQHQQPQPNSGQDHFSSQGNHERDYSPSPLQQGFRNNLASPGPASFTASQFMMHQPQNLASLGSGNFATDSTTAYGTQDYTASLTTGPSFIQQQSQTSNLANRLSPTPPTISYNPQDFNDHAVTFESRMMAVVKEKEKMKALGTHKQMMESLLDQKFKEFKTIINKNLKEKFDVELRRALFHLWKHYKSCNERPNLINDFDRSIHESLKKVYVETDEVKEKNRQLADQVRDKEIDTSDVINRQIKEMSLGSSKDQQGRRSTQEINVDQRRFFLLSQINELSREIENTEEKIKELQQGRQHRIYEAKIQIEEDGRQQMNEIQRTLALEFCPVDGNPDLERLRNEVAMLRTDYVTIKSDWIEAGHGPNPHEHRIKSLEQEYFELSRKYEAMKK